MTLEELKIILDEENYPYFEDEYLNHRLESIDENYTESDLVADLLIIKSGIQEFEVCGMKIPSPKDYFLRLLSKFRRNHSRTLVRIDKE